MVDLERKLTAILAADVVSFSKYMSQDEEGTLGLVKRLETEILTPIVEEHSGKIFKKMGSGYLAAKRSAITEPRPPEPPVIKATLSSIFIG